MGNCSTSSWGIKHKTNDNNIGPFSGGGLEKPNPARTNDTLADGSSGDPQLNVEGIIRKHFLDKIVIWS